MLHVDGSKVAGDDSGPPPPHLELLKYESYNLLISYLKSTKSQLAYTYET